MDTIRSSRATESRDHIPTDHTLSEILIQDYDLFKAAVPHHDEMQEMVGQLVRKYASSHLDHTIIAVLEAGTGTGITTEEIIKGSPRVHLTTVDIELGMIERARTRLSASPPQIEFIVGDILEVLNDRESASIDVFATCFTLHHLLVDQWPGLTAAIFRVLRPGGVYINADKIAESDQARHYQSLREQIAEFDIFQSMGKPELRAQWTHHYLADERGKVEEPAQIRFLREAGFAAPRVEWRRRMEAVVVAQRPCTPEATTTP